MARPLCTRLIGFVALIALLGLSGCYEDPRDGGYDNGGVRPNYGNGYPRDYGYRYGRPYGYYDTPYRTRYRRDGNYCYYHDCNSDEEY
jgi:hypothetical protein